MRGFSLVLGAAVTWSLLSGASASPQPPLQGTWFWNDPDVFVAQLGPFAYPTVGPTQAATIQVGPDVEWVVTLSDAIVSCRGGQPHYSPLARGIQPFDTVVPGFCTLDTSTGPIHVHWSFSQAVGASYAGPMRGDGYFS